MLNMFCGIYLFDGPLLLQQWAARNEDQKNRSKWIGVWSDHAVTRPLFPPSETTAYLRPTEFRSQGIRAQHSIKHHSGYNLTYGVFHKWGYPHIRMVYKGKSSQKNGWFRGTPISGNLHLMCMLTMYCMLWVYTMYLYVSMMGQQEREILPNNPRQ